MPIQRATENTVREAPMAGARLQSANFNAGEIYGKAIEGFGQQLSQTVKTVDETLYKYDLAAAKNADVEDAVELAKIRATALNSVGTEAETATEDAHKAMQQVRDRRLEKLKGRRAELYRSAFEQRQITLESQLTEHAIKQADVAERGAAAGRSDLSVKDAIASYGDPDLYAANMATAEEEFRASNRGASEDALKAKWLEVTSRTHVSIAGIIMSADPMDPNSHKALDWVEAHKGEILPAHQTEILKSLNPLLKADMVTTEFARANVQGAILENGGDYDVAEGTITPPPKPLDDADTGGIVGATAVPGETPAGLDPLAPLPSAAGTKPTAPKAQEPYKNSTALFDAVLGKGNYTVGNAYGSPRPGGKSHGGTDLPAKVGTVIHPPMSGKVIDAGFDPMPEAGGHGGGWFVRVRHPNGTVTGYAHLRGEPPVKEGQQVDKDTIIGAVGMSGRTTGPHLHFTVRDDSGAKVDPAAKGASVLADSEGGPPLRDPAKTSWKEGELVLVTDQKDTLGTSLRRINLVAGKEGWSQSKYDAVVDEAKGRAAANDRLFSEGYKQLQDRVNGKIAAIETGGGTFTSITQLGPDYGRLDGSDQLRVSNMAQAGKKALETGSEVPANGEEYSDWALMASSPSIDERQNFLKQDFRSNPLMTKAERLRLSERQQQMRSDETGKLAADVSGVMNVVDRYAPLAGFDIKKATGKDVPANKEDRRRRAMLNDLVLTRVQQQQTKLGRELTDVELEALVKSQVVAVSKDGKTMPLYLYNASPGAWQGLDKAPVTVKPQEVYDTIPELTKSSIIKGLIDRGEKPTYRAVINEYLRGL